MGRWLPVRADVERVQMKDIIFITVMGGMLMLLTLMTLGFGI